MEVQVAKHSGFCKGVSFAVNTAMTISPQNTYVLGQIIHNPYIVKQIEERGIVEVNDITEVPSGARVIIRSHGVGKKVYEYAKENNIEVVDCTCAFVKQTQKIINEHYLKGEKIAIIGEPTHPEVIGLLGWCNDEGIIITSEKDIEKLNNVQNKICIVSQTTFSIEKFDKIIKICEKDSNKIFAIFKTICYTTSVSQKEAEDISSQVDCMIVLGGYNSSNTNKLYEICIKKCSNVFRIEKPEDLDIDKIKIFNKVGIVCGSSTPNTQMQEVLFKMENTNTENATVTMDDVVAKIDDGQSKLKKGQLVTVIISSATEDGVNVLLPFAKKEVLLAKDEIDCEEYKKDEFNKMAGDNIELMVVNVNPVILSQKAIRRAQEEEAMIGDIKDGKEFSVTCTGFNKGGLLSSLGSYSIFVPAKEIRSGFVKELDKFVGKKLRLKVIEIKTEKKKEIIASQRVILEEERKVREEAKAQKEAEFFSSIKVGDIVEGKVERITAFGAFVNVNNFDCLAHISDLSWTGVKDVSEVLEIGKKYQFKILKIDEEDKKVSIGYKQLQAQPWDNISSKYAEGDTVHGKIVRIVPFGAFVEIEKGVDGLVHVSQITHEWLENPTSVLTIGQEVDAKIIALDLENKKMTLSIKALLPEPEKTVEVEAEEKPAKAGKKAKGERKERDYDDVHGWTESDATAGVSIADLLKKD